jgi:hypothetical protein
VPETFLGKKVRCATCATVFEAQVREPAAPTPAVDVLATATAPANLPMIPVDEPEPRRSRRERYYDEEEFPDDREQRRRRRKRRRDLMPHHGVPILIFGIMAIVLTLIGAICCGVFGAPIGIVMGSVSAIWGTIDLGKMRDGHIDPDGETLTRTGQIMGFVGIALSLVFLLLCGALTFVSLAGNSRRGW